ncbi:MAG: hypothetical protein V3V41_08080 [Candidatus Heimdallarchaeota archaeon]
MDESRRLTEKEKRFQKICPHNRAVWDTKYTNYESGYCKSCLVGLTRPIGKKYLPANPLFSDGEGGYFYLLDIEEPMDKPNTGRKERGRGHLAENQPQCICKHFNYDHDKGQCKKCECKEFKYNG